MRVFMVLLSLVSLTTCTAPTTPTLTSSQQVEVSEVVSISITKTIEAELPTVISGFTLIGIDQRHDKSLQCIAEEQQLTNLTEVQQATRNCWEDDCICRGGVWIQELSSCSHLCDDHVSCPERVCRTNPTCNPSTGRCDYTEVDDGVTCGDDRRCYFGKCLAGRICETTGNMTVKYRCPFPTSECVDIKCAELSTKTCIEIPSTGTPCELGICNNGICTAVISKVSKNKIDLCRGVVCPDPISTCRNLTCEEGRCVYKSEIDGTACSDFNSKTINDTCESGVCVGVAQCIEPRTDLIRSCRSSNPECVTVTCQSDGLCLQINKPDGTLCSDGNSFTSSDSCLAGICVGTAAYYDCSNHPHCFRPLLRCLGKVFPSCLPNYIAQCQTVSLIQHCPSDLTLFYCSGTSSTEMITSLLILLLMVFLL